MSHKIAVIVGSLRRESWTRKIAKAVIEQAPDTLACSFVEIGDLDMYNEDLDAKAPPVSWTRFRDAVRPVDGVLFATPEYNRSVPGCLKNAIDVGSRPAGKSVWDGKPAAVVSATPYKLGAFGANHALRQTFVFLNMPVMQQPEAYIGGVGEMFDKDGKLKNEETRAFLEKFAAAFADWVAALKR
jgi:NAD(P)H-dependent FMN reductase